MILLLLNSSTTRGKEKVLNTKVILQLWSSNLIAGGKEVQVFIIRTFLPKKISSNLINIIIQRDNREVNSKNENNRFNQSLR